MQPEFIIEQLAQNRHVFAHLLMDATPSMQKWRPSPLKWNLLEVVCHLLDEEKLDFRARVKHVLEEPENQMQPIDPEGWVVKHNYDSMDYITSLEHFLLEREKSIEWLLSLKNPGWDNTYLHPKNGPMTARLFLHNWLAHDYLHIRQILGLRYGYLDENGGIALDYAGNW